MKRLFDAFPIAVLTISLGFAPISVAQSIGIASPIQTGFVVITPLQGGGQGLSVSETFGQRVAGNLFQASVLSSPTVTLTDLFVNVDPNTATNTGVAIVNPNSTPATLILSLTNQQGASIAVRTISIEAHQQISRFATQLFAGTSQLATTFFGLMFVSSDLPVAVMGLTFIGPSFTSLPVAAQLSPTSTMNGTAVSTTTIASPVTTTTATATAVPTTIRQIPSTVLGPPSSFIGLAPPPPLTTGTTPMSTTPAGVVTTVSSTSTVAVGTTTVTSVQNSASSIANGALLLPQFATGGGWASQIVIANTSTTNQVVRVDVFNSSGSPLILPFTSSLSTVLVSAGAVVIFSTTP